MRKVHLIYFIFLFAFHSTAQEVSVSKEFNVRNDYAYEILGKVGDNILLYRDRGIDKMVAGFDQSLQYKWDQKLYFEQKRIKSFGITPRDSLFSVFYSMRKDGNDYLKVNNYTESAAIIDSITIDMKEKDLFRTNFEFLNSDDLTKSCLFHIEESNKLLFYIYDHKQDTLFWKEEFIFENSDLENSLLEVKLTDKGSMILLLEKETTKFKKGDNLAEIIILEKNAKEAFITQIPYDKKDLQSIYFSYNNKNERIGFFGLYSEKESNWSNGYCFTYIDLKEFYDSYELSFVPFEERLLQDLYGKDLKKNKKKGLNNFELTDVIWRKDGGVLLFSEMQKRFSRRPNYDATSAVRNDMYALRAWVDFFNEDLVVMALHPNGENHWTQVLYKKQFSQDDGSIYSSYFPFMTPSRLRIIFNDEIKNNNTVSEYIMNPLGEYKRESVLSTEYQRLKLRFRDALQIGPSSLIVPSERNFALSLVKIDY